MGGRLFARSGREASAAMNYTREQQLERQVTVLREALRRIQLDRWKAAHEPALALAEADRIAAEPVLDPQFAPLSSGVVVEYQLGLLRAELKAAHQSLQAMRVEPGRVCCRGCPECQGMGIGDELASLRRWTERSHDYLSQHAKLLWGEQVSCGCLRCVELRKLMESKP